ncbi:MAG: acyl-CoA thioesterase, partial [Rhodobacteraceae bacterium]|nr:acyl-CoA thioesterase [Paracoccaceae bacterium]
MSKSGPSPRSVYYDFQTLQTRWEDNDSYGHMNNIVHYSLIDTA